MLSKVRSCAVIGLESKEIEVEVDVSPGFPAFNIVGLPDKAVEEARERVKSALKNCGFRFPSQKRITVNLAPADIRKEGPVYDLPIAAGILLSSGQMKPSPEIREGIFIGELSLKGELRHTRGILPVAIFAANKGIKNLFIPSSDTEEARLVGGLEIFPLDSVRRLTGHFSGTDPIESVASGGMAERGPLPEFEYDFAHIKGQQHIKRALEIAAAGGHNILMA